MAARGGVDGGGWVGAGIAAALTVVAVLVHGYHPYAEDGGLYLAEIERMLNPRLFAVGGEFVTGHLGIPVFAGAVAWVVRGSGLSLPAVVLGLHALCVFGVLLGAWRVAGLCYEGMAARMGAVGLTALWLGLPVAGTSLLVMDPYVTARSAALALTVLGLGGVLRMFRDGGVGWVGVAGTLAAFAGAVAVHPLMGGYGVVEGVLLAGILVGRRGRWVGWAVAAGAVFLGGAVQMLGGPETAGYAAVAATRHYWFLGEWRWFEWVGLIAPLGILAWVGWGLRGGRMQGAVERMGVWAGGIGAGLNLLFVRVGGVGHGVARMQPLRSFQMVYVAMAVAIGAWLGERVLGRSLWRWGMAGVVVGGVMFGAARVTYPASDHLEMPGIVPGVGPRNGWEQAFLWIRGNTPEDAVFAMDADYVHEAGEDAQGFRGLAERSVLADYSKDGGQAAIRPELTGAWAAGQRAQAGLSGETDAERVAALRGTGVGWVVLRRGAVTGFACPYRNDWVVVCRVPGEVRR